MITAAVNEAEGGLGSREVKKNWKTFQKIQDEFIQ